MLGHGALTIKTKTAAGEKTEPVPLTDVTGIAVVASCPD
jgi:hypothetical protein